MGDATTQLWHIDAVINSPQARRQEGTRAVDCCPNAEQARQEPVSPDVPLLMGQERRRIPLDEQDQHEGGLLLTKWNLARQETAASTVPLPMVQERRRIPLDEKEQHEGRLSLTERNPAQQETTLSAVPFAMGQERRRIPFDVQEPHEGRLSLTERNLARHALEFDQTSSKSSVGSLGDLLSDQMTKDKRISSSDDGFGDVADCNGLQTMQYSTQVPSNLVSIMATLTSNRQEPQPSTTEFQRYVLAVLNSSNEAEIEDVLKEYLWNSYESTYTTKVDVRFTNIPQDVGFNNDASPPQPDIVQGFQEKTFRRDLLHSIAGAVPHKRPDGSVALPHLAGELKYPRGGDMLQARLQSCYAGAALVWARHNALDLIGKPDLDDGQARVFTFNFNGMILEAYACLRVKTDDGRVEYHQHLLKGVYMTGGYDDFKAGWTVLRNLQDLAKKESADLRDLLRDYAAPARPSTPAKKGKGKRQATSPPPTNDESAASAQVQSGLL